jgi:hypothetical protein
MRYTKLTVLGLCAMLVGLMALGASAAQAEGTAWVILNAKGEKVVVKKPLLPVLTSELEGKKVVLTASLFEGAVLVELRCTGTELIGIHLGENGSLSKGGKVKLTGCTTWINEESSVECKLHSSGEPVGSIVTNKLKGLLLEHEGSPVVEVSPESGSSFVSLLMGSECVLGEELVIEGKLVFKDCEGLGGSHLVTHLFEENEALTELFIFGEPAHIEGSATVSLTGEHKGLKWGAGSEPPPPSKPSWLALDEIEGKVLENVKAALASKVDSGNVSLLAHMLGMVVKVSCSSEELSGANLETEGKITAGFKAKFSGCSVTNGETGKSIEECQVKTSGQSWGTLLSNGLKGELVKGEKENLIKVEPKEGTTLATLLTGEACLLAGEIPLSGTIYLKDGKGELTTNLVEHLVQVGPGTELWVGAKTSEHLETSLDGSAILSLSESQSGLKWGAMFSEAGKGTWLVVDGKAAGTLLNSFTTSLAGKAEVTGLSLLTHMVGIGVKISCSGAEVIGASLKPEAVIASGFKAKFTGCEVLKIETGKQIEKCVAKNEGGVAGTIETKALKASFEKTSLVKVEPEGGGVEDSFVVLTPGTECLLAEKIPLHGVLYLNDSEGKLETLLVEHVGKEATGTKLWVGIETAEHLETSVDGGMLFSLAGEYTGLKWSGMVE